MRQRAWTGEKKRQLVLRLGLLALVMAIPVRSEPPPDASHRVSPTTDPCLNFRPGPELTSTPTDCLGAGTLVTVVETAVDWTKVRLADGREGWVSSRYLDAVEAPPVAAPPPEEPAVEEVFAAAEVPLDSGEQSDDGAQEASEELSIREVGAAELSLMTAEDDSAVASPPASDRPVRPSEPLALRDDAPEPPVEVQRQRVDQPLALVGGDSGEQPAEPGGPAEVERPAGDLAQEIAELRATVDRLEKQVETSKATEEELWIQLEESLTTEGRLRASLSAAEAELEELRRGASSGTEDEAARGQLEAARATEAELRDALEGSRIVEQDLRERLERALAEAAAAESLAREAREREAELEERLAAGAAAGARSTVSERPQEASPAPVERVSDPSDQVRRVLEAWAAAWSEQRAEDYLAFYSERFTPPGEAGRQAWETERRQRIEGPEFIRIVLDSVGVRILGAERASARFTQSYRSNTYSDRVIKVLDFVLERGSWKISGERVEQVVAEPPS